MTDPVVRVGDNSVKGRQEGDVAVFRGIPYAAGPSGADRFAAPKPATWTGEFDAGGYGPTAPQSHGRLPGLSSIIGDGWVPGDEYLNLNIWTPDVSGGLPVMVFIHGGAFIGGAGSAPGYDGTRFAEHGVVLVTINYRLGIPGFLRLPGAPDNRGLLDQIAALEWVREHIAGFGGNPANITVFGESAGGLSIGALLAVAPPGLFRRAIVESGGASQVLTAAQADVVTAAIAERLGLPVVLNAFADVPEQNFVDAVADLGATPLNLMVDGVRDPLMGLSKFGPVMDGKSLDGQPVDRVRAGASAAVDVLAGSNSEEMNLYLVALPLPPATDETLPMAVAALHPDPAGVIAAYRDAGRGASPTELLSAIGTDYVFGVPTTRLAQAHADHPGGTWQYEFAWRSPAVDGRLGACHGLELPFVFDNIGRVDFGLFGVPDDEPTRELAARTHAAWIAFARDGDPGWSRFTSDKPVVRRIDTESTVVDTPRPEQAVWEAFAEQTYVDSRSVVDRATGAAACRDGVAVDGDAAR